RPASAWSAFAGRGIDFEMTVGASSVGASGGKKSGDGSGAAGRSAGVAGAVRSGRGSDMARGVGEHPRSSKMVRPWDRPYYRRRRRENRRLSFRNPGNFKSRLRAAPLARVKEMT